MSKLDVHSRLSSCEAWTAFREDFERLLVALISRGGKIVSTGQLSSAEIIVARRDNRMAVDPDGFGYVWFPDFEKAKTCADWTLLP